MTLSKLDAIKIEKVYAVIDNFFGISPEDDFDINPVEKNGVSIWAINGFFYKAVMKGETISHYKKYAIYMSFGNFQSVQSFHLNDFGIVLPEERGLHV